MSKGDLLAQLAIEEQKLADLSKRYQEAKSYCLMVLEQYCNSNDGSDTQEARRESHLQKAQETEWDASAALDAQQQLVDDLKKQLQN